MSEVLDYDDSALLRTAIHETRFDVWEYFNDGDYPHRRGEKAEVERRVAAMVSSWGDDDLADVLSRNEKYLAEWAPDRLHAAKTTEQRARLGAFAELQWLIEDSRDALNLAALEYPRATQPLYREHPYVLDQLTRDGLFPIGPGNVSDAGGSEPVFREGDLALYPHPDLRPLRELLFVLADLATIPELAVSVALDPHRISTVEDVPCVLLADQWWGIELTQANLDSLDGHDVGVPAFHAAVNRSSVRELFDPLLGTWFEWTARRDDFDDSVKCLYVREVRPAIDREGDRLVAVRNRELHTERDTQKHRFTHVDGKIRRFPEETYKASASEPHADTGPHSNARKLWRVDGPLSDEQWCELAGLHFRGNELIEEHFRDTFPGRVPGG